MFQSYRYHNEDCPVDLGEFIINLHRHGLTVVDQTHQNGETFLTLQGTQEQFLTLYTEEMEGGPAICMEDFLDELEEI